MNKAVVLFLLCIFLPHGPAQAQPADRISALQDENFFLQDEIKKLKAELMDKDGALKNLLLEKEAARTNEAAALKDQEALEIKVDGLQKLILARDEEWPRKVEQAATPYRVEMENMAREMKAMTMLSEEKGARLISAIQDNEALRVKVDMLTGEKISLRDSLKKIAQELEALKADVQGQVEDQKESCAADVKDFQVRLAAEQTLTQEKIGLAKKPLEALLAQAQVRAKKFEEQITALRGNAGLEAKKLQEQLDACRQGARTGAARK